MKKSFWKTLENDDHLLFLLDIIKINELEQIKMKLFNLTLFKWILKKEEEKNLAYACE